MRIIVTGGTGFVGRKLVANLLGRNHGVVVASRDPEAARARLGSGIATCPLEGAGLDAVLRGSGAVIHLAGEPVVEGRWTPEKKARIRSSRVDVTRALVDAIGAVPQGERPGVLVAASAVGWYGDSGEAEQDESSPAASDFLGSVCQEWEAASRAAESHGLRVALIRLGVVLARDGGALAVMERPFRMGVGAPLGSGANWMPWIHGDDAVAMIGFALERSTIRGAINAVAPEPARQIQLARGIARRLHRPCWPGIPRPLVRLIFGEKSAALLASQRVTPRVALDAGFAWRFRELEPALDDLFE